MINPWESELGRKLWKTSSSYWSFIRGKLRLAWNNHPIKISVINKKRYQIDNPNPNGKKPKVWGFDCEMCGLTFPISQGQVDHITPAGTLTRREDIQGFVERLLCITEDDLRLVCKDCNNALSIAQKQGISYDEAIVEKRVIKIIKEKKDKSFLIAKGITPATNAKKRREQIKEYLTSIRDNLGDSNE
jgi:hypothetical protein